MHFDEHYFHFLAISGIFLDPPPKATAWGLPFSAKFDSHAKRSLQGGFQHRYLLRAEHLGDATQFEGLKYRTNNYEGVSIKPHELSASVT